MSGLNRSEVEKSFNNTQAIFNQAQKDSIDAFAEGDGAKHVKALQTMSDAGDIMKELRKTYANLERVQPQTREAQQPRVDYLVVNKAKAWAQNNSWYDPNGSDDDSAIAKAISGKLANEGYDPKTNDFWDELSERLSKRGIGEQAQNDDDYEDDEEEVIPPKRRTSSPPVNGGSKRGDIKGKKTLILPTSYVNMLKASGIYDDPEKLKRVLANRERILKENGR